VLLEEADPSCFLHLGRTKDGALLTINSNSKTSSEVLWYPVIHRPLCTATR
jgi:protease II